jgi:phosphate-selective porin
VSLSRQLGLTAGLALTTLATSPLAAQQAAAPAPTPAVKFSGYIQARETYQNDIGLTGSINRARLNMGGGIAHDFSWRISGEFRTGSPGKGASVALADGYIRWVRKSFGVQAGQFKTPFTREYYTGLADVETADRSTVVDSLAPKRDIGVMADYSYRKRATLQLGVFNGEGQNVTSNKDSTVLGVARLVVRPIKDVAVGANVARYFGDSTRYGVDANYEGRRLTVRGEYVAQARDDVSGDDDKGWFALAAFKVVDMVQLVGKYEDFSRDAIGAQQANEAWTGGANLFFAGNAVRLSLEYISRKIGDPGVRKGTGLAQLQLRF